MPLELTVWIAPYFYCYKAIVRNPRPDRIWEIITRVNTVQWRGQKDSVPETPCLSLVSSHAHPCDRLQSVAGVVGRVPGMHGSYRGREREAAS